MGKKKVRYESQEAPSNNPFGGLDISFSEEETQSYEAEKEIEETKVESYAGGLVRVRLEKKGRGGKTVTIFYGFERNQKNLLTDLFKDLKKHLATGGKVVEDELEFQGDQRLKAADWLGAQGYKVKGQLK
ncbi:MAG: translation initiation factor [Lentisphaeraceae bacterium]|nr:translation initiation factor [Lentisphaeraceae bacterium]